MGVNHGSVRAEPWWGAGSDSVSADEGLTEWDIRHQSGGHTTAHTHWLLWRKQQCWLSNRLIKSMHSLTSRAAGSWWVTAHRPGVVSVDKGHVFYTSLSDPGPGVLCHIQSVNEYICWETIGENRVCKCSTLRIGCDTIWFEQCGLVSLH